MNVMKSTRKLTQYSVAAALAFQLVGCGGSSSSDSPPDPTLPNVAAKYTDLNGSGSAAVYLDLDSGATLGVGDRWHLAYQKYVGFKSNGGVSGTAGMSVCVAKKYDALYDDAGKAVKAEFQKLDRNNTLMDFNAVKKSSCSAGDFKMDGVTTQIKTEDWLAASYGPSGGTYSVKPDNGWIIKSATKADNTGAYAYARVRVNTVDVTKDPKSRKITLQSEKWNGSTFDGVLTSPVIDFTSKQIYWDLETNSLVSSTDDWELSIKVDGNNFPIQVNGGASGRGDAGVGALQVALEAVSDPTQTSQVYKYFGDTASGALSTPGDFGPFAYAVGGDNHVMWPTFTVYVFKDGDKYFKAQVVSNNGADGAAASGNLYIRYEQVWE